MSVGSARGPRWRKVRAEVLDRDGWRCRTCGVGGILEVDHIEPIGTGGRRYDPLNCQTLCRPCHIEKTRLEHAIRRYKPDVSKWRDQLRLELEAR